MDYDIIKRKGSENYKNNHPFLAQDLQNLPLAINNPIAVFNSASYAGDKVILTELKRDNHNFIVVVRATNNKRKGNVQLTINEIITLYPKQKNGIIKWLLDGLFTYINKEKALDWLGHSRSHPEPPANIELSRAAKIIQDFKNPTLETGKIVSHIENISSELNTPVHLVSEEDVPREAAGNVQRGVKGWFNIKTGEVYINVDACENERDASETLLHEVVGHKGLRALMGEEGYKQYMRNFLMGAPEEIRAQIAHEAWANYHGDFYEAIDEYLAAQAEGGIGERTMWRRYLHTLLQKKDKGCWIKQTGKYELI